MNRFDLKDRVVIVTGGLGQLGHAFATGLADEGAKVAVFDLTDDRARIHARYGDRIDDPRLLFVKADVTSRASLENGVDRVVDHWGAPPMAS